jgi:alkylated DNA repair dioxygenase AlkB
MATVPRPEASIKPSNDEMTLYAKKMPANVLPNDGIVHYYGKVMPPGDSNRYLDKLLKSINWQNDEAILFGRRIITKRKVAWYGGYEYAYTYSKITRRALPWTQELMELRDLVASFCGTSFNSCLLNLYHNGDEGMAWHSDDEKTLEENSSIASLSLGAERKFWLKHRQTKETISVLLEHGSLLEMKGATQKNWCHCLPKSKKIGQPRVNLTFRTMAESK